MTLPAASAEQPKSIKHLYSKSVQFHVRQSPGFPMDDAEATIRAFVLPERQDRYLALLRSSKGRAKLRRSLAHFSDLDTRFAEPIVASRQTSGEILTTLTGHGAPMRCYLLSEDPSLDGEDLPLEDTLSKVVGRGMGTFVSCVPGRLGYFEGEDVGARYILRRPA